MHRGKMCCSKNGILITIAIYHQVQYQNLVQFGVKEKFKLGFNNRLVFAGKAIEPLHLLAGKTLYIPQSENHPAFTLIISGQPFTQHEMQSFFIDFSSEEECDTVSQYEYSGEIFFIGK